MLSPQEGPALLLWERDSVGCTNSIHTLSLMLLPLYIFYNSEPLLSVFTPLTDHTAWLCLYRGRIHYLRIQSGVSGTQAPLVDSLPSFIPYMENK